ncbi:hypothetical protein [uncultured Tateyamaria sp.]|uniref:hypothetical protein n=1 Tax=uncultured Tateyamaria sp. TaxID=455651 RepID=UPI00260DFE95|nr:hypothetical protein [uncultured Tateyamaria sp.]
MNDHDWIIGVCKDLRAYAEKNGLDQVASAVTNALNVAIWEIEGAKDERLLINSERTAHLRAPSLDTSNRKRCQKVILFPRR